jgi:hypothetical protein
LTIHEFVLDKIRPEITDVYVKFSTAPLHNDPSDQELLALIFKNYRRSSQGHCGLRLSKTGYWLLNKHFDCQVFDLIPAGSTSNQILIQLDKKMQWPYYIDASVFVFFNNTEAAWFKLADHKITNFLETI